MYNKVSRCLSYITNVTTIVMTDKLSFRNIFNKLEFSQLVNMWTWSAFKPPMLKRNCNNLITSSWLKFGGINLNFGFWA